MTVVVAADNYPGTPRTGDPITGLEDLPGAPTAYVLHAGTARDGDGALVSAGRPGAVGRRDGRRPWRRRASASTPPSAGIDLPGSHHRTDIALRAERGEVTRLTHPSAEVVARATTSALTARRAGVS